MPEVAPPPHKSLGAALADASKRGWKPEGDEPPKGGDTPPAKEADEPPDPPVKKEAAPPPKREEEPPPPPNKDELSNPNLDSSPPAPKKEAAAPVSDELPKGMTKEAAAWAAKTRVEAKEAQKLAEDRAAEIETLKTQVNEAATAAPEITRLKAELEAAQKKIEEFEGEISLSRVEVTPQFKEKVSGPLAEVDATVSRLGDKYEIPKAQIQAMMGEEDESKRADLFDELTEGFKSLDRTSLSDATKTFHKAQKLGEEMRGKAKGKLDEFAKADEERSRSEQQKTAQEYQRAVAAEFRDLQERFPLIKPVEGKDDWNAYLQRLEREAASLNVNDLDPTSVARGAVAEKALTEAIKITDHLKKRNAHLESELQKANQRIAEYVGGEPGAGSGSRGSDGEPVESEHKTLGQAVAARMARG